MNVDHNYPSTPTITGTSVRRSISVPRKRWTVTVLHSMVYDHVSDARALIETLLAELEPLTPALLDDTPDGVTFDEEARAVHVAELAASRNAEILALGELRLGFVEAVNKCRSW